MLFPFRNFSSMLSYSGREGMTATVNVPRSAVYATKLVNQTALHSSRKVLPLLCPNMIVPRYVCAHTRLRPDTFVPRYISARTHLSQDMIVPIHDCAQTCLYPDTFVPRHVCAQKHLCSETFVPKHDYAHI